MRTLLVLSTLAALVAGTVSVAHAQKGNDKNPPAGKVKVYDFDGDTIDGDLIKPEGSTVDAREFGNHASLIRIRTNFIPEIIKSAEDLP